MAKQTEGDRSRVRTRLTAIPFNEGRVVGTFHVPTIKKHSFFEVGGRHTEYACYLLNGIAINR
jgi:hypothetical protein